MPPKREKPLPTDPGILDAICERLSSGESMNSICKDKAMPTVPRVYAEMGRNDVFRSAIARAREAQQDFEADNMIELADAANEQDYNVVKLRIWARQWRAAKLAPKKYGDKIEMSGDKSNPITVVISHGDEKI